MTVGTGAGTDHHPERIPAVAGAWTGVVDDRGVPGPFTVCWRLNGLDLTDK